MQTYHQLYSYDKVGNFLKLQHIGGVTGSYTRNYNYTGGTNRLDSTIVGATPYVYTYDNRGNMVSMPHLSSMDWNADNRLQKTSVGMTYTYFNYSGGERIRKVCEKVGGIMEERIYLGNYERYRRYIGGVLDLERTTVHIMDDSGRMAMLETETGGAPLVRVIYSNMLQSSVVELDASGNVISYEEYHPFGTTAYQSNNAAIAAAAKRYRYTGKERDEETGLYYHGARYYIPWICRWSASDPLESKYAGLSPYNYSMNNPVMMNDPSGMQGEKVEAGYASGKGSYEQPIDLSSVAIKPKSTASAADNTSVYQINPELLRGAQEREAAQKAIDEQPVLMADIYGNGHIGPRAQTEAKVRGIQKEYYDAVGANVAGGFFGALGYLIAGDQGSFAGAGVDNAAQAVVATGSVIKARVNNNAKPAYRYSPLEPASQKAPVNAAEVSRSGGGNTFTITIKQASQVNPEYAVKISLVARVQGKLNLYPDVIDPRTGRNIPLPYVDQLVPKEKRVTWDSKARGAFIKEWYDRGYKTPSGGWDKYDIHHIKPREAGGGNNFWNLVPVERTTHQTQFNAFWRQFGIL